jgi:transcription elongation factor Elf1
MSPQTKPAASLAPGETNGDSGCAPTRIVALGASHNTDAGASRSSSARATWLIAPALLAATITGMLFVVRGPDRYFGYALGILLALAVSWILISVLHPARVERTCPMCRRESLSRLDAKSTRGVICDACGFSDPHQSSFLMAESEGALEDIVIAERERAHAASSRGMNSESADERKPARSMREGSPT